MTTTREHLAWFEKFTNPWGDRSSLPLFHPKPAAPPIHFIGVDLGQTSDPTAIIVARQEQPTPEADPLYLVGHVERVPLQTTYPAIVAHLGAIVAALRDAHPGGEIRIALDQTGCGRPVCDLVVDAQLPAIIRRVTITSGDAEACVDGSFRVPKRNLVAITQVVLQEARLRIADELPFAATLAEELAGFRAKISVNGNVSYAAGEDWRSAPHDDLVLALALALWDGEKRASYAGQWFF